jgi:hypothetical protein
MPQPCFTVFQVPMKYQKGITVLDLSYNQIQDIPRVRALIIYCGMFLNCTELVCTVKHYF